MEIRTRADQPSKLTNADCVSCMPAVCALLVDARDWLEGNGSSRSKQVRSRNSMMSCSETGPSGWDVEGRAVRVPGRRGDAIGR